MVKSEGLSLPEGWAKKQEKPTEPLFNLPPPSGQKPPKKKRLAFSAYGDKKPAFGRSK